MRTRADVAESVRISMVDLTSTPTSKTNTKNSSQKDAPQAIPEPAPIPQRHITDIPRPLLCKIFHVVAPDLRTARNVSRTFRDITSEYVRGRVKKFRESIEEAECWGGRAPTLADIIFLDPLAIQAVVEDQVGLARDKQPAAKEKDGTGIGGVLEVGDDHTVDDSDVGASRSEAGDAGIEPPRRRKTKQQSPAAVQKRLFAALRAALDSFELGAWPAVRPLCEFIRRHGLQYTLSETDASNAALGVDGLPPQTRPTVRAKDQTWLKLNAELYALCASTGQINLLPALSDLANPLDCIQNAMDLGVRLHRTKSVVAILTAAMLQPGLYWPSLSTGLDAAIATIRVQHRAPLSVILVLLDAAFNNPVGPYVVVSRLASWSAGSSDGQDPRTVLASELLEKAEECAKLFGLAWHRISSKGEFGVVTASEVAREVKSRTKVM
ncbi:hypothetical protein HDV00_010609 [Rhizophlyctis rosea]|nr:hypothetical protein HDV00_010609 [Rhizophlyctis rosea]